MSANVAPNIVRNGLVFDLDAANPKSYVSGSSNWNDLTLNQRSTTLSGSISYSGGGLFFTGSSNAAVSGSTILNNNFSFSVWFKPLGVTNWSPAWSLGSGWGDFTMHSTMTGAIYCGTDIATRFTPSNTGCGDNTIIVNNIYNLTFTYGSTIGSIYKNGVFLTSQTMTAPLNQSNNSLFSTYNVYGVLANVIQYKVQIYNRALAASEVLQNYNALKTRFGL